MASNHVQLALCLIVSCFAPNDALLIRKDDNSTMQLALVQKTMADSPLDVAVQESGCKALVEIANMPNNNISQLLSAGMGTSMVAGLRNILATPTESEDVKRSGTVCLNGIGSLHVAYNHDLGVQFYTTSPHMWHPIVEFIKRFQTDRNVLLNIRMFAGLFGHTTPEVTKGLLEAGGFDFVFDILDQQTSDKELWQAGWCALSDHAEAGPVGAAVLADHGGINKGCAYVVKHMRQAHGVHFKQPGQPFGLNYQILHDANGMLLNDQSKSYLHSCIRAGLPEEIILTMRDEPDDRLVQDTCCIAIKWVTERSLTVRSYLAQQGVFKLIAKAIQKFPSPDKQLWTYPVVPSCAGALLNLANSSRDIADKLLRIGILELLDKPVQEFANYESKIPWVTPWMPSFPSSNIAKLREILLSHSPR